MRIFTTLGLAVTVMTAAEFSATADEGANVTVNQEPNNSDWDLVVRVRVESETSKPRNILRGSQQARGTIDENASVVRFRLELKD